MFLKKLRARNNSNDETGGILERIRNERSVSPSPKTISALADNRSACHMNDASSYDRFCDDLLKILHPVRHRFNDHANKAGNILSSAKFLVDFHRDFFECHGAIRRYEKDLGALCSAQSGLFGTRDAVPLDELVRRAYMHSAEADRQFKSSFLKISQLEESVKKRTFEVRALRGKVNELESELLESRVGVLKDRCLEEVGGKLKKQSAVDALIDALKDSEKKRRQSTQELIRLKAIIDSRNDLPPKLEVPSSNVFQEIIELREVVKDLSRSISPRPTHFAVSLFPPSPLNPPRDPTDLTGREEEEENEIFACLSKSFTEELQKDSESPRD